MSRRHFASGAVLACTVVLLSMPALSAGAGPQGKAEAPHTLTWWCADLNEVWHVKVPMIGPRGWLVPPDPSPIPDPCIVRFPAAVPEGSSYAPGNMLWFTNKTYPPAVRAALTEKGYVFHSQSPAEDFMSKFVGIRVQVKTYPGNALVSEHHFDPRKNFRLIRVRDLFFGPAAIGPIVNPDLGIDMSAEEVGRLPLFGFPVILPPPGAPGEYRIWTYWTMSDWHNDGTCLEDACILPAGEFSYISPRLTVVP